LNGPRYHDRPDPKPRPSFLGPSYFPNAATGPETLGILIGSRKACPNPLSLHELSALNIFLFYKASSTLACCCCWRVCKATTVTDCAIWRCAAAVADLYRLDLQSLEWAQLDSGLHGSAPSQRASACMAAIGTKLYVLGGFYNFNCACPIPLAFCATLLAAVSIVCMLSSSACSHGVVEYTRVQFSEYDDLLNHLILHFPGQRYVQCCLFLSISLW
jgi:hypothetical protein